SVRPSTPRAALWIDGRTLVPRERVINTGQALEFRLRHSPLTPRIPVILDADTLSQALGKARKAGCRELFVLNAANGDGQVHFLNKGTASIRTEGSARSGLTALETLARAFERRPATHQKIDIVFIVETGGSMHRVLNDASETISRMGITLQNGLPVPDVHWGLMTFSGSERLSFHDLSPSSERIAQIIRDEKPGFGDGLLPIDGILQRLVGSVTWRGGSRRYAVLYANGRAPQHGFDAGRLEAPGIRLITIPADDASTGTHQVLQSLARRSGGRSIIPEYLVRYRDQANRDRAFVLKNRTLLRMTHDIPERNWKRYYSGIREPAGGSRRFRAGTIDESIEILGRSGQRGIRIREVQSSLGDAIIAAINSMQTPAGRIRTAHPDALCTALHQGRRISMPVVMDRIHRVTPQAGTWLGINIIPDYYAEGRFRVHPQSLQIFPAHIPPPVLAQQSWSGISRNPGLAVGFALFDPGRIFLNVRDLKIIPIVKKPYILEP
ncbi:MAG TPA: hypothetical protein PLM00_09020, partial [Spirochaetota bacterium]|nr:hypothetical protein [Spirochaetota bacterium]